MESGWIVNFKNGTKVAMTEEVHEFMKVKLDEIISEEHWFALEEAIKKNPGIKLIKGS